MSWSLGEVQALTIKAARGAGHPWGVADEAGWAVRWLAARGLSGVDAMATVLDNGPSNACPLLTGISIADKGKEAFPLDLEITTPLIVLPFIGRASGAGCIARVDIGGNMVIVTAEEIKLTAPLPSHAKLSASLDAGTLQKAPRYHRIEKISEATLQILSRLAQKTYAPATEASRKSGAGAGLTDND